MQRIYFLLLSLLPLLLSAEEKVIKKYNTGEIASIETKLNTDIDPHYSYGLEREKVEVFDRQGNRVFVGYRRNTAGHSSVHLAYHENGGVKIISTSSAPDAGIQWYRARYELDEDGNIIKHIEDNWDTRYTLRQPLEPQLRENLQKVEEKKDYEN